jgi:hypothetical protein
MYRQNPGSVEETGALGRKWTRGGEKSTSRPLPLSSSPHKGGGGEGAGSQVIIRRADASLRSPCSVRTQGHCPRGWGGGGGGARGREREREGGRRRRRRRRRTRARTKLCRTSLTPFPFTLTSPSHTLRRYVSKNFLSHCGTTPKRFEERRRSDATAPLSFHARARRSSRTQWRRSSTTVSPSQPVSCRDDSCRPSFGSSSPTRRRFHARARSPSSPSSPSSFPPSSPCSCGRPHHHRHPRPRPAT